MVGAKGGRALRQTEGDDSHSRFFLGKLVSVGVSVFGGGVAKGASFACITKKHGRLGV